MRGERHAEGARQRRDLEIGRDAADPDHVRLDEVAGAAREIVAELLERVDVLADRERGPDALAELRMGVDVVGEQRLLDPVRRERLEGVDRARGPADVPALVGVDHDRQPARDLADFGQALDVLLDLGLAHLDLERLEALGPPAAHLLDQLGLATCSG